MQAFPLRTRFHRQELSNILWALATLQHELPTAVLRDVSEEFVRLAMRQLSTPKAGRYGCSMCEARERLMLPSLEFPYVPGYPSCD